ncbi:unnamed protein product [Boreogadus saida]
MYSLRADQSAVVVKLNPEQILITALASDVVFTLNPEQPAGGIRSTMVSHWVWGGAAVLTCRTLEHISQLGSSINSTQTQALFS